MKLKVFWEIFYRHDTKEFEIRGPSTNDTDFTNKVWEMQQEGYDVGCNTPPCERSREDIIDEMRQRGHKHVEGLFDDTYSKRKKPKSGRD